MMRRNRRDGVGESLFETTLHAIFTPPLVRIDQTSGPWQVARIQHFSVIVDNKPDVLRNARRFLIFIPVVGSQWGSHVGHCKMTGKF